MTSAKVKLTENELRQFGFITGTIVVLLFGLLFPWLLDVEFPYWPWVIAILLAGTGLIFPGGLRPVYSLWMKFGMVMQKITTPLILGILYFLVITPIGIIMRISGHDSMAKRLERSSKTYRVKSQSRKRESMERPF